jgi:hypothetical protein
MNWLERARREIGDKFACATAKTAEAHPTAATAVLYPSSEERQGSIGGKGSPLLARMQDAEALHEAFEERAAIMEFDGGMSHEDAERTAWALVLKRRQLH